MGIGLRGLGLALATALIAGLCSGPAGAANWLEKSLYLFGPRYTSDLPSCETPYALHVIQRRFGTKEGRFWNSDLRIVEFDGVREVAFRPWADGTIPRRFCTGRALISDGRWRALHYSIIEDAAVIGTTWGVEWCVVGVDRNWAYNPACKMARP